MLVNFSNHPSSKWGEKQLQAAGGEIVDVRFPNVDPHAGSEKLDALAEKCVHDIGVAYTSGSSDLEAVLVQGEMTLCYRVVTLLKGYGIRCVAATSERNVVETTNEDGTTSKRVVFNFIQFRSY